eukprot:SAG31_NODE_186_length_20918_cov_26.890917_2_plen_91_part_00
MAASTSGSRAGAEPATRRQPQRGQAGSESVVVAVVALFFELPLPWSSKVVEEGWRAVGLRGEALSPLCPCGRPGAPAGIPGARLGRISQY